MADLDQWFRRDAAGNIDAFKCGACDAWHDGLPLSWHAPHPLALQDVPEDEWGERVLLGSDQCIIEMGDTKQHFMRGMLRIPVHGREDVLEYGVWVALSEAAYERAAELWETEGRESEPPFTGTLSAALAGYPDLAGVELQLQTQPVGERPLIHLQGPADHPLVVDQREGIDESQLLERVAASLGVLQS